MCSFCRDIAVFISNWRLSGLQILIVHQKLYINICSRSHLNFAQLQKFFFFRFRFAYTKELKNLDFMEKELKFITFKIGWQNDKLSKKGPFTNDFLRWFITVKFLLNVIHSHKYNFFSNTAFRINFTKMQVTKKSKFSARKKLKN